MARGTLASLREIVTDADFLLCYVNSGRGVTWNAEHYGASVREVADGTKNADSAGLNRFPIRPATFARSAAYAQ